MLKKKLLPLVLPFALLLSVSSWSQTLPVLPSPNYDAPHDAFVTGKVTTSSGAKNLAGIVVKLYKVVSGSADLMISAAMTDASGNYTLTGKSGDTYRVYYEYPTTGFTAPSGSPSTSFVAAAGTNVSPSGGIDLSAIENTITNCNVSPSQLTDWDADLTVAKAVAINSTSVLQKVSVYRAGLVSHPTINVTATTASAISTLNIGAYIFITGPNETMGDHTVESVKSFAGVAPAQRINLSAGESLTYYDITSAKTSTDDISPVTTAYLGTGNVTFAISTTASKTIATTGGNTSSSEQTYAASGVCLTYVYNNNPLPVTLASFTAEQKELAVDLNWQTTHETNSSRFDIERSRNGKDWTKLTTIAAKKESSDIVSYNWTDVTARQGENLYRLKMIDLDETYAYSRIRSVAFEGGEALAIFPNPATDYLKVSASQSANLSELVIANQAGNTVLRSVSATQFTDGISLASLPTGFYLVKLRFNDGSTETKKLAVSR